MANIFDVFKFLQRKDSQAGKIIYASTGGNVQNSQRNYEAFAREGYQKNVITFKSISMIAKSASSIPWIVQQRKGNRFVEVSENDPLRKLIYKPSPLQSWQSFFESLISYYVLNGNSYIEANKGMGEMPLELYILRPDRMKIVPGKIGIPKAYIYKIGAYEVTYDVDQIKGLSPIMHYKTFNPTNDWYGMSPCEAAIYGIDTHNASSKWNYSLLKNSALPSLGLAVKSTDANPNGTLTTEEYERLKSQISEQYSGASNSGKPLLLEGGFDIKQLSMSPKDMDWINSKNTSARDIALAFGLPPILLNIPGDSTYSNYKEARSAFYEDTVIPILTVIRDGLNMWLAPYFGDNYYLDFDRNNIDALVEKRDAKFAQIKDVQWMTVNEKRSQVGLDEVEGMDVFLFQGGLSVVEKDNVSFDSPVVEEAPQDPEVPVEEAPEEEDTPQDTEEDTIEEGKNIYFNRINRNEKSSAWKKQNSMREKIESAMIQDLKEMFDDQAESVESAIAGSSYQSAEREAERAIKKYDDDLAKILSKYYTRTLKTFGKDVLEMGKSYFGIAEVKDQNYFNQFMSAYVKKNTANKVTTIQNTSITKARAKIKKYTEENLREGEPTSTLAKQVKDEFKYLSKSRSDSIARTETHNAQVAGSLEAARSLDIPGLQKEWVSVNDDRTRDNIQTADHASVNGQRVGLDEKFYVMPDTLMEGPGDDSAPAEQVINCLHPSMLISSNVFAATRSEYIGDMFEIKTKAGQVLTVTANHPIATDKGFVKAHELSAGNNLISDLNWIKTISRPDNNVKNKIPTIENVFHSLHVLGNSLSCELLPNDLYGDGKFMKGNINIVFSTSSLLDRFKSQVANRIKDLGFEFESFSREVLSSNSSFDTSLESVLHAPSGSPSASHLGVSIPIGFNINPLSALRFGLITETNSILSKSPRNNSPIDGVNFTKLINRNSTNIGLDNIVNIKRFNYSGHVYDLQTDNGYIISNGIVMSNCRCTLVYNQGKK